MGVVSLGHGPDGRRVRRKVSGKTKQVLYCLIPVGERFRGRVTIASMWPSKASQLTCQLRVAAKPIVNYVNKRFEKARRCGTAFYG
jgi:hypothetical protein